MVDHCDLGCCATWFAGWEKTMESAETIPTAQEIPISHLASFIPATTGLRIYEFADFSRFRDSKIGSTSGRTAMAVTVGIPDKTAEGGPPPNESKKAFVHVPSQPLTAVGLPLKNPDRIVAPCSWRTLSGCRFQSSANQSMGLGIGPVVRISAPSLRGFLIVIDTCSPVFSMS